MGLIIVAMSTERLRGCGQAKWSRSTLAPTAAEATAAAFSEARARVRPAIASTILLLVMPPSSTPASSSGACHSSAAPSTCASLRAWITGRPPRPPRPPMVTSPGTAVAAGRAVGRCERSPSRCCCPPRPACSWGPPSSPPSTCRRTRSTEIGCVGPCFGLKFPYATPVLATTRE
jgi:hypothetical protein